MSPTLLLDYFSQDENYLAREFPLLPLPVVCPNNVDHRVEMIYPVCPSDYFAMGGVSLNVTISFADHDSSMHYLVYGLFLTRACLMHFLIDTNDFVVVVIMMLK